MPVTSTATVSSPPLPQPLRRGDLTLSGFVSSAIVVLALIGGTYWLSAQERSAQSWIAHTEDHHPDLSVSYNRCDIAWSTHSVGGLSINDFICAARVDALSLQAGSFIQAGRKTARSSG